MLTDFRLDGQTVMVAPESGFYGTPGKGLNEIRTAYVLKEEDLRKALVVFRAGLEKYKATADK
jgi:aspartate aminotransferase